MNSSFLKLNTKDLFKGALIIVGTAILTAVLPMLQSGKIPTVDELKVVVLASVSAGITYFVKNLFTNSDGNMKPETKPDV
jgi:hypothetical protein